jgi:hypothetical protein
MKPINAITVVTVSVCVVAYVLLGSSPTSGFASPGLAPLLTWSSGATAPMPSPTPTVVPQPGLPLTRFTTSDFSGSGTCATCHTSLTDSTGHNVSIDAHWRSTILANAAKDPLFQANVSSEVARTPALQAVIEDKCANCHMPMAYTQAVVDGTSTAILDSGFLSPTNTLHPAAMDGVSCTLCHQIQDAHLGQPESFSGNFQIDTATEPPDRLIFGPFPEPEQSLMRLAVGYTPVEGHQTTDSALCATCHTLYTPVVDAAGNVVGQFPEQTGYLEWKHSQYGDGVGQDQICQQCHMPEADGPVVISVVPGGLPARSPFAQHHLVGGNTLILEILRSHVDELGLTTSTTLLSDTLTRSIDLLQMRAASLSIVEAQLDGDTLAVVLRIENRAGHKFPTGFPSRRAWVHLTVADATGAVVFESGRPQADGSIAGNNADEDPATYEPHYDVISRTNQVEIYESVMRDTSGQVTYTLLRGAGYAKDNRLLPAGFDKTTASQDFAVYGQAAQDENFVGGADQISYQVDMRGYSEPFTVLAELLYQSVSYRFVQDLRQVSSPLIVRFSGYYDEADKTPATVVAIQQTVGSYRTYLPIIVRGDSDAPAPRRPALGPHDQAGDG